jgi:radical SAM protein (TIGR01212 family)
MDRYNIYSKYLKDKYGLKVYKIPVSIENTCPNRDGKLGYGGCTFCSNLGTGYEIMSNNLSIKEQVINTKEKLIKKYKAEKFIIYFQNYSNTYMKFDLFKKYINESVLEDVVEISISTRPDTISIEILEFLKEFSTNSGINISFEIGLQTVNYRTLDKINRGHGIGEFIDAVLNIKKYGFEICAHVILNLPGDEDIDVIETAKVISALKIESVKLHSLNILKGSIMGIQYLNGEIEINSYEDYIDRMIKFIRYLDPTVVIQRLFARAPEEQTIFSNWNMSWWKLKDIFDKKMEDNNYTQGDLFNYLNGKAL